MLQLKSLIFSHECVPSQEVEKVALDAVLGNVEDKAYYIQAIMTQR